MLEFGKKLEIQIERVIRNKAKKRTLPIGLNPFLVMNTKLKLDRDCKAILETKSKDRKEVPGYSSSGENDPSIEEMNKLIEEKVIRKSLEETTPEDSQQDSSLYADHTHLFIQPSRKLNVSRSRRDAVAIHQNPTTSTIHRNALHLAIHRHGLHLVRDVIVTFLLPAIHQHALASCCPQHCSACLCPCLYSCLCLSFLGFLCLLFSFRFPCLLTTSLQSRP